MILKLAAFAVVGFAAYKFVAPGTRSRTAPALAGGPLSDKATLQANPDEPPPAHLYRD